jgi:HSP20 family protein
MAKTATAHLPHSVVHLGFSAPGGQGAWTPNTDVYETSDLFIVKMELAGVEPDELELTLQDRLLVVCGFREDTCRQPHRRCKFRQMEIDYGPFERRIVLPQAVDGRRVRARLHNGFLRVELPKTPRAEHTLVAVVIERA